MRTRCSEAAGQTHSRVLRLLATAALTLGALAGAGCGSPKSGAGAAPAAAAPPSAWPQGRAAPVRVTDALTLSIPLEYLRSALSGEAAVPGAPGSPPHGEVQFDFFLPGFTGYTLENYRRESDENRVEVVYLHAGNPHEADPDAPGEYPPNMLKRLLADAFDPGHYSDQYGLRCYQARSIPGRIACYGRRDARRGEDILLTVLTPPYPADAGFPLFQARYFSRRYGGVRLEWRTHTSQLPRWQEIDAQIWKFIEEWRVAPAAPDAGPAPQTGGQT